MKLPVYEVKYDHIQLNTQEGTVTIDEYVIGIQIRVFASSGEPNMTYGLNEAAGKVPLSSADMPAGYGGYHVNNIPCITRGELNWRFESNTNPKGMVILTRLVPRPVEGAEIEDCN